MEGPGMNFTPDFATTVLRQQRARRQMALLAVILVPVMLFVAFASGVGLLGVLVERPAAFGWPIGGCGFALWMGTLLWVGWATVRAAPLGSPLPPEAARRTARVLDRVGTMLARTAIFCFFAEVLALVAVIALHGSRVDINSLISSLLPATLMALLGRHLHEKGYAYADQAQGRQ
jgi:hypothetical protein